MFKRTALTLLALLFAVLFPGCAAEEPDAQAPPPSDLQMLAEREIREFEGEALSSILDFRENSIKGPQSVDLESYRLRVDGLVDTPVELTYEDVLDLTSYRKVLNMYCVEGWSVTILWEGVKVSDLLDLAGVDEDANTVIFHAQDEYTTSLPLDTVVDRELLLAWKMNDVVLPAERGFPFQLVAEDKLGYKWIKWVTRIELSDDASYRGFWESRGYNNEADV